MEIKDYVKATSSFLKASDIQANPTALFVITGEGTMVKSEKFGNEKLHIDGEFAGEKKTMDCAKTNARLIAEKLGDDTKKWIGHTVSFETYKTKTSDGKLVDALSVKEVK